MSGEVSNSSSSSSEKSVGAPLVKEPTKGKVLVADGARPSVLRGVASYIIVNEFCERLAFYGFAGSLVLFFQTKMGMSNAQADIQYSAWNGACYVTPLLGGYVADTWLGRSKTILLFSCIYSVGLLMVVVGSAPDLALPGLIFAAIYTIALGTGGIKPNVSTLGADQFDERFEQDRKEKASFFNWFYWSINLGAIISYTLITYICTFGIPQLGGVTWGFFVGYTIPCVSMVASVLIFVSGLKKYRKLPPSGSVLSRSVGIVWSSCRSYATEGKGGQEYKSFVDRALSMNGGRYTEEEVSAVKMLIRIMPFMLVLIPFWGIYSQMSTAFQNQACQMQLDVGSGVSIPPAALNLFDSMAILMLVPIFDRFLYPSVGIIRGRDRPLTMLQKIGWGFVFALLSMVAAAVVEEYRLAHSPDQAWYNDADARENISPCHNVDDYNPARYQQWEAGVGGIDDQPSECHTVNDCSASPEYYYDPPSGATLLNMTCISCEDIPQMSGVSVFWQIPQFVLIGTAEILAAVTALEFFYSEAPESMKSVAQSLNLFMNALGTWATIPIVIMVNTIPAHPWLPENLDDGNLTYYFLVLGAIMFVDLLFFFWISSNYAYVNNPPVASSSSEPQSDDSVELVSSTNEGSSARNWRQKYLSLRSDSGTSASGWNLDSSNNSEAEITLNPNWVEISEEDLSPGNSVRNRIRQKLGDKKRFAHLSTEDDDMSVGQQVHNTLHVDKKSVSTDSFPSAYDDEPLVIEDYCDNDLMGNRLADNSEGQAKQKDIFELESYVL